MIAEEDGRWLYGKLDQKRVRGGREAGLGREGGRIWICQCDGGGVTGLTSTERRRRLLSEEVVSYL